MALQDAISITLDDVKLYIKLDEDDTSEDATLQMMIDAAIAIADRYLCRTWTSSDYVPADVRLACLAAIDTSFEHRDNQTSSTTLGDYRTSTRARNPEDFIKIPGDFYERLMTYRLIPGT